MRVFLNHMKILLENENPLIYSIDSTTALRISIRFNLMDDNFSPSHLTPPSPLRPARVFPTPQRQWGGDGARF